MSIGAVRSRFHFLIVIAVSLTCGATIAIGLTIWWLRSEAIREASREADNLATVLAEQATHSVQSIELMLNELEERIEGLGSRTSNDFRRVVQNEETYQLLLERAARLSHVATISLADKNGLIVNSTNQWPMPHMDVSDREHFLHVKSNDSRAIYISSPVTDRFRGIPTIFFLRRLNDASNRFLGAIIIGVRLSYFKHIYESITSLSDMSFLFLRRDGMVIVRYPDANDRSGETMPPTSPWYQLIAQGGGYYRSPGYFDGIPRHIAVHPLRDYPLVVNVAISETAALANWRIQAISIGLGTLLVVLCSGFLLVALSRQFRRLASSEVTIAQKANQLEFANDQLERSNKNLDTALNNMAKGLLLFDSSEQIVVCNQRYVEMYGLSLDVVKPGCSFRDLIKHHKGIGSFDGDYEEYHSALGRDLSQGKDGDSIRKTVNGRSIRIVNQPMANGGWVSTHEDITERRRAEAIIEHMARYDTLTDLPNRTTFNDTIRTTLDRAVLTGEKFAVLSIDLDRFKEANDTHGHLLGDALLREVAGRLQAVAGDGFLARIGGDEFVLIVSEGEQPAAAEAAAERLLSAITGDFNIEGHQLKLGLSIGVAIFPTNGADAKALMMNADAALYRAKAETPGNALFFEPEMDDQRRERRAVQEDLRSAIDCGELLLHYQPQKKLSGETIGFEALLRWQCPKRGMVAPGTFIRVAEESSLIIPIGEWVLREACREAASWPEPKTIAVNISPIQFGQGDLPGLVHSILLETGLPPGRLELEITESVMINNFSRAVSILNRLKALGISIAMDDFGTGYSSLSYLHSFSCDRIKIDRVFICDLEHNHHSRAIVRAVIGLGKSLKLPILAEGVETEFQRAFLVQEGCDEVQGYLTGRPLPIVEYAELVGHKAITAKKNYGMAV
jgi:diguanylate cyclase (GGDEF)-like protein/PAS domain S-box-containing protein